ncbi:uncharacterized protein TrAtP1_007539 [Trichoderma atroviride]|uniref:uncharacterized protein n=1 Tax=Hypocrea atroviridis TaxID=63577 RepID=UPI00331FFD1A|nr:hypothetical protein TrAtP1_007539 [Trichoderma atroviride]
MSVGAANKDCKYLPAASGKAPSDWPFVHSTTFIFLSNTLYSTVAYFGIFILPAPSTVSRLLDRVTARKSSTFAYLTTKKEDQQHFHNTDCQIPSK